MKRGVDLLEVARNGDAWAAAKWLEKHPAPSPAEMDDACELLLKNHNVVNLQALLATPVFAPQTILWGDALLWVVDARPDAKCCCTLLETFELVLERVRLDALPHALLARYGGEYEDPDCVLLHLASTLVGHRGLYRSAQGTEQLRAVVRRLLGQLTFTSWEAIRLAAAVEDGEAMLALHNALQTPKATFRRCLPYCAQCAVPNRAAKSRADKSSVNQARSPSDPSQAYRRRTASSQGILNL